MELKTEIFNGRGWPRIIQGGMGIAVSSWRLARRVAEMGEMGVVSGTAIDSVVVRELQRGDPNGRLRSLARYPDQEIVEYLKNTYFVEGGIPEESPYKLLPIHRFKPTRRSQRILSAATYSEVVLAKEGHKGVVGINLMAKLKRHTLACMVGAMLAGVDAILIGAGIPIEEAEALRMLADAKPARLRLDVDTSSFGGGNGETYYYELNPTDLVPELRPMPRPAFLPIISSDLLANILHKKLPAGTISGIIIEGPVAGGHNAPPRNKGVDENLNPVYDERDHADLDRILALGYPVYLAGGYGSPEGLQQALAMGATGIQVGTLFSLTNESGYPAATKAFIIERIHRRQVSVRTDGRLSSTGFPFKAVEIENTLGIPELLAGRRRICDLGYLQTPYLDERGTIQGRCSAEPVEDYVRKGGAIEDTERRGCLCNGLLANIGLGQVQKWGKEMELFTAGDDLVDLPLGSVDEPYYSAEDAIRYLRGEYVPTQEEVGRMEAGA